MNKLHSQSFKLGGESLSINLIDFWQWAHSDLLSNTLRGVLAEFIVASALGLSQTSRLEWDAYDLTTKTGLKLEVKSSAYLQSWAQNRESLIRFSISQTKGWNALTNITSVTAKRQADIYVFCLFKHKDRATADPLNLDQWTFFLLPTSVLDAHLPNQKSISLSGLAKLKAIECDFNLLSDVVQELGNKLTN